MEIVFDPPKEIVTTTGATQIVSSINIMSIIDWPDGKLVEIITTDRVNIALWMGTDYDAIGQWTDTDVVNRINELYT